MNSIGKKFLIPTLLFMMILLGGLGALLINKNHATIQSLMESKATALADVFSQISAGYVMNFDLMALEVFVKEALKDPDVVFIVFYDTGKKPLTESSKPPADTASLLIYDREIRSLRGSGEPIGYLQIGYSRQTLAENLRSGIQTVVLSILVAFFLLILGVTVLFRGITQPLGQMVRVIEKVAQGDLTARVASRLVDRRDEMGVLARSFNRMSEELARSHEHLEEQVKVRTAELESFIYTVSHDLKAPVVSMQGMASLLDEDWGEKVDERGRRYIHRIIHNANYMEELITGLLSLSRIGRKQQNTVLADVKEVLAEILEIHQQRFLEKKVQVLIHPSLPSFTFEKMQLTQLFQNLITNGVKFMGDQSSPKVEIGGEEKREWVEFYVRDNGIGIDPAYHSKIFGLFQRLKDVEVEGTGVGLSIVKKIVDLAGGKIRIESAKGKGTTFFIVLPKSHSPQQRDPKNGPSRLAADSL